MATPLICIRGVNGKSFDSFGGVNRKSSNGFRLV
jgi:hypothetical protein